MRTFWVPEHPRQPLYRAKVPVRTGKRGERESLVTNDIHDAMQFESLVDCEAWIAANPHPKFVAREHSVMCDA